MKIIKNAEIATKEWMSFNVPDKEKIRKYFFIRPTNSGITIVTTLPFMPMRGKVVKSGAELKSTLQKIIKSYSKITQTDEVAASDFMKGIGFNQRSIQNSREENYQAIFINSMNDDHNLKIKLGSASNINYVASELIFERGNYRVDVVGYNGSDLFFFEFKNVRTTKVNQVSEYVDYYTKNIKILSDILEHYPMNPVSTFNQIKGVMVMPYAESAYKDPMWKILASKFNIDIVFFAESLLYHKV